MFRKKHSFAFTLAEALLTITIIGITMTLMMRGINRISPDKEKILFIKTFHAMEHVIADTISDPTKYDQNYYTDIELDDMEAEDKHIDFCFDPLDEASVTIDGKTIYSCKHSKADSAKCIDKDNAICYFLANGMNTSGPVNCQNNTDMNFRTTNGVCIYNLVGMDKDYSDPVMSPLCNKENDKDLVTNGYAFVIYGDGKMSVPKTHQGVKNQEKAYNWMKDQTQVK